MSNRSLALQSGTLVDAFEIRRVIGTGGFGVTYLGFDRELERPVAIKEYCPQGIAERGDDQTTLVPASDDDQEMFRYGLGRFLDEARTLAKFQHPSIVHVHRFLEGNGTGYLIMDYEEGQSLWQVLLRQKSLAEAEVLAMLLPILEGLEVIHAQRYLHRDIKPGNIMLRDTGPPVLLDFGAARQALEQQGAALTVMLTPGYAPIEQYSSTDQQGPWSDLYAVGATCFHCMTGSAPVAATDRLATFHGLGGDPVHRQLDELQSRYDAVLLDAVKWMLEATPAGRPQTTAEVLAKLRALNRGRDDFPNSDAPTELHQLSADFDKTPELSLALQSALEKSGVKVARKVVGPAMATAARYSEMVEFLAGFILDDTRQSVFIEHVRDLPAQHAARATPVASQGPPSDAAPSERPSRERSSRGGEASSGWGPPSGTESPEPESGTLTGGRAGAGPPTTQSLRDEVIAHAERHLADFVGPIASVLVDEAAATASNRDEFYRMLADELDSAQEREAFLKSLR
jgi:serine/threonine protein kinase